MKSITRRQWIRSAAAIGGAAAWGLPRPASAVFQTGHKKPRVAAITTVFRFRSHAYNILENFFEPYLFRGKLVDPGVEIVSLFSDQFPEDDMARTVSQKFQIPLYDTIEQALTRGGKALDVDGVLLVAEHGDYPYNELGQHLYPRKPFFDRIVAEMKRAGRSIPVFNDKHLSYRWDWAREMYDVSRALKIPFMAGSSVPLAERRPQWELPDKASITEAVSIHGGGLESYDFHALEVLQSIVEARSGGETGVTRVELLADAQYDEATRKPDWPHELIDAALAAEQRHDGPRQQRPSAGVLIPKSAAIPPPRHAKSTQRHAIRLTYSDGLKATILKHGSSSDRWNFACRLKTEAGPRACMFFNGPWGNRCLFKALSHAIQHFFRTGEAPYPVERTLLVSGILDAAVRSHHQAGTPIETPHLAIPYQTKDYSSFRERGESWRILTHETPQPMDFSPGDRKFM